MSVAYTQGFISRMATREKKKKKKKKKKKIAPGDDMRWKYGIMNELHAMFPIISNVRVGSTRKRWVYLQIGSGFPIRCQRDHPPPYDTHYAIKEGYFVIRLIIYSITSRE